MSEEEEDDLAALIYKTSKTAKARAAVVVAAKEKIQKMNASAGRQRRTSTRKRSEIGQDDGASVDRPRKKKAVCEKEQKISKKNGKESGRVKDWRKYAKKCSADGCTNLALKGGVCVRHGAKVKQCSSERCTNIVVRGGVCMRHGAKVKPCSIDGCTNYPQRGGVCIRHGAKVKLCSNDGCTNKAYKGGVCIRHGANRTSNDGSTAFGSETEKITATRISRQSTGSAGDLDERSTFVPEEVVICQEVAEL